MFSSLTKKRNFYSSGDEDDEKDEESEPDTPRTTIFDPNYFFEIGSEKFGAKIVLNLARLILSIQNKNLNHQKNH